MKKLAVVVAVVQIAFAVFLLQDYSPSRDHLTAFVVLGLITPIVFLLARFPAFELLNLWAKRKTLEQQQRIKELEARQSSPSVKL